MRKGTIKAMDNFSLSPLKTNSYEEKKLNSIDCAPCQL